MHSEPTDTENVQEQEVNRRTFLSWLIVAVGGFITAVLGIPVAAAAIAPALKGGKGTEVSAGPANSFPVGEPKAATVTITIADGWVQNQQDRGIWVIAKGNNDFTVFNGRCVHLGCAYSWVPATKEFDCPCHGGRYSITGEVLGGPPPRPLDTLQWRVDQGNLLVNYEDFRLGIPQKEEA